MECGDIADTVLGLTRARLEKLREYEGCRVRLCTGGDGGCYDGILEQVDIMAATVALHDLTNGSLTVLTIDPNSWELQVYKCPGGHGTR